MIPHHGPGPTGNDHVSIPAIGQDASIPGVTVLHAASSALVEWAGPEAAPLFRLRTAVDGTVVEGEALKWRRLDRWIPTFTTMVGRDIVVRGVICAPAGYPLARGFFLRVEVENNGRTAADVAVALDIRWAWSRRWIATGRACAGSNRMHSGNGAIILECDDGRGPALAVVGDGGEATTPSVEAASAPNGTLLTATLSHAVRAAHRRRVSITFFIAAGREPDGALAAAAALRRRGADELLRQARLELSHLLRAAQDHRWSELLNRNLLFCRYFAAGRGIDDDRLWLVRSRSTHCTAPGLFNEREALLWTVPALIAADPGMAREALLRCLDVYSERSGEYLRYLDGGAFDSGFILEQFLLYAWAIDHYVAATQDSSLLDEPVVLQVVLENDAALYLRLHPEHMLCSTELLPSGDAADHPWTTMGNALVRAFAAALPRIYPRPEGNGDPPPRFEGTADEVAAAVWQHCTVDVGGEHVLAWSADLAGGAAVYDDPAMSLALLPFFGFCAADDPVWTATMEFLRSRRYPLYSEGMVPGIAHRSRPGQVALPAIIADLLAPRADDALATLLRIRFPDGIAAAACDPASGEASEPHHGALAGFLAWTLIRAAGPKDSAHRQRRGH
jgi:hypothetical protein